jgi:hypothetical protein
MENVIMPITPVILGFVPFISFGLLSNAMPAGWAALVAGGIALVLLLSDLRSGVKLLSVAGVVVLGMLAAVGLVVGDGADTALRAYGSGTAVVLLAAIMLATAARAPFTAQYARQSVNEQYWHSATFISINRRLSAAWGLAALVMGAASLAVGGIEMSVGQAPGLFLLRVGVPAMAIIATLTYSKRVVASAHSAQAPAASATAPATR